MRPDVEQTVKGRERVEEGMCDGGGMIEKCVSRGRKREREKEDKEIANVCNANMQRRKKTTYRKG